MKRYVPFALIALIFACEDPTAPLIDTETAVAPHLIGAVSGGQIAGLRAAVAVRGKARLFEHARVSGLDRRHTRCDDCEAIDVGGFLVEDAAQIRFVGEARRNARVRGAPPILVDPNLGDDPFSQLGDKTWDEIAAMAKVVLGEHGEETHLGGGGGHRHTAYDALREATNQCGSTNGTTGESATSDSPCANPWPIVLIRGRVVITGRGRLQGLFVLDVDERGQGSELDLEGYGLRVQGIVLGRGCVEVGGRTSVSGAIVVDGSVKARQCRRERPFEITDFGRVRWSSGIVRQVLAANGINENQPPTASFIVGGSLTAGTATSFDASGSTDPQGGMLSFDWDFDDGGRGSVAQMSHVYNADGGFDVALTVMNEDGVSATTTQTVTIVPGPAPTGVAAVSVLVRNSAGDPLPGVTVEGRGGVPVPTDVEGLALLSDVPTGVPTVVRLTAVGFVDQFVRIEIATGVADAVVEAVMIARGAATSIDADVGGTVLGEFGASIELPAGALVDAAGDPVTGTVDVTVTPIDVAGDDISAFPGSFAGVDPAGTTGLILTFGVAEFLITQGGEVLDLAPGTRTTIEVPIFNGSPAIGDVIELWTLDEGSGVWIMEGTGEVVASPGSPTGLALRAEIGHLSWWNCDIRFLGDLVEPLVRCTDQDGNPIACFVQARAVDPAFPRGGVSDHLPPEGKTLIFPSDVTFRIVGTGLVASELLRGETTFTGVPGGTDEIVIVLSPVELPAGVWESVSAGGEHTCGVRDGGAAFCWGEAEQGQLGNPAFSPGDCSGGEVACAVTPSPVEGSLVFATVSAGGDHSCGIATDGVAHCWGRNQFGRLGDGSEVSRETPVAVAGGLVFASVTAGSFHTCGVTTDGTAYCWGNNDFGQLGVAAADVCGGAPCALTPAAVAGGLTFVSLSAGRIHTCGVATDGTAYCWGLNDFGLLGDGTEIARPTPVPVEGGLTFSMVAVGAQHSCGVATDGTLYCWGDDSQGQLGSTLPVDCEIPEGPQRDGPVSSVPQLGPGECSFTPAPVEGGLTFASVTAGFTFTCGVATDGAAFCWGTNGTGQLGDGTAENRELPTAVVGGFSFASLNAGNAHTCGVTTTGLALCWGRNLAGQRGDGTTDVSPIPLPVSEP